MDEFTADTARAMSEEAAYKSAAFTTYAGRIQNAMNRGYRMTYLDAIKKDDEHKFEALSILMSRGFAVTTADVSSGVKHVWVRW